MMRFFRRIAVAWLLCAIASIAMAQEPVRPRLRIVLDEEPFREKLKNIVEAEGLRLQIVGRTDRGLTTVLEGETLNEIMDDLSAHAGHLIVRRGDTIVVYAEGAEEIGDPITYTYTLRGMPSETALEQLRNLNLAGLHAASVRSLNAILLRGPLRAVTDAKGFLETIDQPVPNVMIELLVVEYFHGDEFHWGFNILEGTRKQFSGVTYAPRDGRIAGLYNAIANLPGSFKFNLVALVLDRSAKVVTNPHVSVRNSEKGVIRLDETQNLIVTNPTDLSGTTRTLQGITSSVILEITPFILDRRRIQLAVHGEVGVFVPSETPDGIPGTETNRIESSVTVADGETLILGGLIKEVDVDIDSGVPYLRRVPLLGYLFKEKEKRRLYTETVVYITPRIADDSFFTEPSIEEEVRERMRSLEEREKKFKKRGW